MKEYIKLANLRGNSIQLYECLILNGPQSMSVLAQKTGLNRSSCYTFIKPLMHKGLVTKCILDGITYYYAEDPKTILKNIQKDKDNINLKFEVAKNLYKKYESNFKRKTIYKKPKVKYYEGEKGLQEAYEDTLKSSEDIRAYANIKEMHKGLPGFFPDYYKKRSKNKIFIHTICPDNYDSKERSKQDKEECREIRFIDKNKYEFTPEINIYDNKILFASWKEKMAIVIESEEISDFHKKIFDVLYEKLKK